MSEQRLIDANAVEAGFDELCQSPYFKNDVNAKHGAETLMDLCVRSDSHKLNTIDPETLPIVQELREENKKLNEMFRDTFACDLLDKINKVERELERVKAERDAAVRDLYIAKDCNTCALRFTDDCLLEECMDSCDSFAYGDVPYKWRGSKRLGDGKNGE